jgi:predicted dehydrogenase
LLRFISGRDMVSTAAFQGKVGFPQTREMENTAAISYQLDNGGTADVRLDYLRPKAGGSHGDDRVRIAGTKGIVEYQGGKVTLMTDDKPLHEVTERPNPPMLFEDFLDAVFHKREPLLTQAEIFRVTEIVIRSREAADAGRVLAI